MMMLLIEEKKCRAIIMVKGKYKRKEKENSIVQRSGKGYFTFEDLGTQLLPPPPLLPPIIKYV